MSGITDITLGLQNLPMHTHQINADVTGYGSAPSPVNNFFTQEGDAVTPVNAYSAGPAADSMNPAMCSMAGGSQPFSIQNPMLGINFIIAVYGLFPSRN